MIRKISWQIPWPECGWGGLFDCLLSSSATHLKHSLGTPRKLLHPYGGLLELQLPLGMQGASHSCCHLSLPPSQARSSFTPAALWPQSRPALNQPQLGQLLLPEGAKTSPAGSLQAPPTLEVLGESPQADTMQDLPGVLQAPQTTC